MSFDRPMRPMLALAIALLLGAPGAEAGMTMLNGVGGSFNVGVKSLKEMRFRSVVKQQYDFSCGSAALATLLTYNYQRPTTEQDTFKAMYEAGDKAKIQKEGFSLLDMKRYLESHGYRADGFRVSLDKLAETGVPAIVLVNINGYMHFVVVKGVSRDEVLVGDPALGLRRMPRADFESSWNGILFVIHAAKAGMLAHSGFNSEDVWQQVPRAPLGLAVSREALASFSLLLPGKNDF
ncbi:MAG: C39 family peptidase [Pseudomonadota bacterium]|uniref:C39 family peptidase n=1 Tax=Thermithiobacillus tepidarius TaxID=929 RepID=UPI00041253C0|nr:C39 family peptidase [Thermithiobacillus tepidarius]